MGLRFSKLVLASLIIADAGAAPGPARAQSQQCQQKLVPVNRATAQLRTFFAEMKSIEQQYRQLPRQATQQEVCGVMRKAINTGQSAMTNMRRAYTSARDAIPVCNADIARELNEQRTYIEKMDRATRKMLEQTRAAAARTKC